MPPIITGLYQYTRNGSTRVPYNTLQEIPLSLSLNPWYRSRVLFLAGDKQSAYQLENLGLQVYRVFDDAPFYVKRDAVHKMKHWIWFSGQ